MQPVSLFVVLIFHYKKNCDKVEKLKKSLLLRVLIFVVKMLRAHHLESYSSFSHLICGSRILMIYNLSSPAYDVIGQPLLM